MPENLDAKLRAEAKRLLTEEKVDVVIGFQKGSLPIRMQPLFARTAQEAEKLTMNGLGANNLAVYLNHQPKDKRIAIVCRGCESRAIQTMLLENRHAREDLYLIGVPCDGILDVHKLERSVEEPILSINEEDDEVIVKTKSGEQELSRVDVLHDACLHCTHPEPTNTDILLEGEGFIKPEMFDKSYTASFRGMSREERYARFQAEAERCIRCYACREACPMCYCEECFVDHSRPQWTDSTIAPAGQHAWHIIRAFHQAGRCVSCGACERACPMEIKMTYLTDLLNEDIFEKYAFEPGMDAETQPPFLTLDPEEARYFAHKEADNAD